ncbi:MAG: hypothetical protein OXC30_06705 [Alphaproteobacteria bacterium]|nr:hypothetical protein [Alphaproteobacteria bacterium]
MRNLFLLMVIALNARAAGDLISLSDQRMMDPDRARVQVRVRKYMSCASDMWYLLKNRDMLEQLGRDVHFLDKCLKHFSDSVNDAISGVCKDMFVGKEIVWASEGGALNLYEILGERKYRVVCREILSESEGGALNLYEQTLNTLSAQKCTGSLRAYIAPRNSLLDFRKKMLKQKVSIRSAVCYLCDLACKLMTVEIIFGLQPVLKISIQGIAAYINDRLECLRFPPYKGVNTDTLNALLISITRGKSDFQIKNGSVVASGRVCLLEEKAHGLHRGLHPPVMERRLLATYYYLDEPPFRKTRAAFGVLIKFGLCIPEVQALQSSMDEAERIPGYLYHAPLTQLALNEFLQKSGKALIVQTLVLKDMPKTVERIVLDMKNNLKKNKKGNYELYKDVASAAITRDDLVALEGAIMENDSYMVFSTARLKPKTVCAAEPSAQLLLGIRVYIKEVLSVMQRQKEAIVGGAKVRQKCHIQLKEMLMQRQKEAIVGGAKIRQECHMQPLVAQRVQNIKQMSEGIEREFRDLHRKIGILYHFAERLNLDSKNCFTQQPVNMILMFLRSLGVQTPCLVHTAHAAQSIFASICHKGLGKVDLATDFGGLRDQLLEIYTALQDVKPVS